MDYIKILNSFDAAEDVRIESEARTFKLRRATITQYREFISRLPDLGGLADVEIQPAWFSSGVLTVLVEPKPQLHKDLTLNAAEKARSLTQQALGIPATRHFNMYDGSILYVFKVGDATVKISGGRAAPTCKIVPKQVSVTQYEMVCPDPPEPEKE